MVVDHARIESEVQRLGTEIFADLRETKHSWLSADFYTDLLMEWAMKDEELKVSMFRFVDILPSLTSSAAIVSHAQEFATLLGEKVPSLVNFGLRVNPKSLPASVLGRVIKRQVRAVAQRFVVGETPADAMDALRRIRRNGTAFTIDLLGEATVSETESLAYLQRYLDLLTQLRSVVPSWEESAPIVPGHLGEQCPINISVKLSALYSQVRPTNMVRSIQQLTDRLLEILVEAKQSRAFVFVDMEDTALTDIILETFKRAAASSEMKSYPHLGIVLQAYLRRTPQDLDDLLLWTKQRGTPIGVRLVKGAYWDTEAIIAKQRGWPIPVWQVKSSTDAQYEQLTVKLLENYQLTAPAFGSHNIRSLCYAVCAAHAMGVPRTAFELQALYGMADQIRSAFARRGYLVREYSPIGDLISGMGYLVRRLLENTSNEGFLRQSFKLHDSPATFLTKPVLREDDWGTEHLTFRPREEFRNVPGLDLSLEENRRNVESAVAKIRDRIEHDIDIVTPVVGGIAFETNSFRDVHLNEDPSHPFARVFLSDASVGERAIQSLHAATPTWRNTPMKERAEVLFRAAQILHQRREDLIALMVLETGKQWSEGDGDVCEAIDFCNYYALEALRLGTPRRLGAMYPGELNLYFYEPRGITAVIAPWNFPLAIPCGMFAASLVMGNPTILKPAEQSSRVGYELFRCFLEAGLPPSVAAFLPGLGEELGAFVVQHPLVTTIAFTGSKQVGLDIVKTASIVAPSGQVEIKRVVAELGGKNAIIVDDDADLDEAVKGVIYAAFGYQGQKCSACSRVIAVGNCYERFTARLADAVRSMIVGPASDSATVAGPVIDKDAFFRLQRTIEEARLHCKVIAEGPPPPAYAPNSYYIRPIVFGEIPAGHEIITAELFGPVLALFRAKSFEEALAIALDSEYGLTGAIFSRSPRHIEIALREFRVGNLYINRHGTGALVNRQPFGGARMSGIGSKAGGPDYLLQFAIPRSVCENTIRRGFAPE